MTNNVIEFPKPATMTKEEAITAELQKYHAMMSKVGHDFVSSFNTVITESIKEVDTKLLLEHCPAALVLWDRFTEDSGAVADLIQRNMLAVQKLGSIINGEITLAAPEGESDSPTETE